MFNSRSDVFLPHKSLLGLILGVYILIYHRRYASGLSGLAALISDESALDTLA